MKTWEARGLHEWTPSPQSSERTGPSRALVLGGGGATGIAWLGGLIGGLFEQGLDLREADTIIGTSAGSVVGAHLRLNTTEEEGLAEITGSKPLQLGRAGKGAGPTFVRSLVHPRRAASRALVGRVSTGARTGDAEDFVTLIGGSLVGRDWPDEPLLVTAIDADDGTAVVFTKDSGVPLERALAASCSVPGVFPPVPIDGRVYMDGGVRSVANVDLAAGHDRVLVLAPIPWSIRPDESPARQARRLRPAARTRVVIPDAAARRAIGLNVLDMKRAAAARAAGHAQAKLVASQVARVWNP